MKFPKKFTVKFKPATAVLVIWLGVLTYASYSQAKTLNLIEGWARQVTMLLNFARQ